MPALTLTHKDAERYSGNVEWSPRRLYKSRALIKSERGKTCGVSWFRERMDSLPPDKPGDNERLETMGFTIRPMPVSAPTVVEVPDEVAKDLEALWVYLQENPEYVASATFDSKDEIPAFVAQAKSWALNHVQPLPEGEEGTPEPQPLEFRKLYAGKAAPDTFLKFTLRTPLTDEEKAKIKAKNDAAKAKADAAKAKAAKAK
jgi:hypothetical protein